MVKMVKVVAVVVWSGYLAYLNTPRIRMPLSPIILDMRVITVLQVILEVSLFLHCTRF